MPPAKKVPAKKLPANKAPPTIRKNAKVDSKKDPPVKPSKKDVQFLKEAGPVLGPALLALLRDPSKPPFNNAFRENGKWKVPPGGVENYKFCEPDADEATLNAMFSQGDLYCLEFDRGFSRSSRSESDDHPGEWKLKCRNQLKSFIPLQSFGLANSMSRLWVSQLLPGNFTTYAIDNGEQTDYENEWQHLIVLHERADLLPEDWCSDDYPKCYY